MPSALSNRLNRPDLLDLPCLIYPKQWVSIQQAFHSIWQRHRQLGIVLCLLKLESSADTGQMPQSATSRCRSQHFSIPLSTCHTFRRLLSLYRLLNIQGRFWHVLLEDLKISCPKCNKWCQRHSHKFGHGQDLTSAQCRRMTYLLYL